jgi:hypothetical protein
MTLMGVTATTARKGYTCADCGSRIFPGLAYLRACHVDGGDIQTVHIHPRCAEMASRLSRDGEEWYGYDEFRESCTEAFAGPFPWEDA